MTPRTGAVAYTVLVNSSDGFSDCWDPFFTLLHRYWPDCPARILLNTERATYADAVGRVESTRVQPATQTERLQWSACLAAALAMVRTPLVLYLQEDYFLEAPVRTDVINAFAEKMLSEPTIANIGLTTFGSVGPYHPTSDERLCEVRRNARYRISTQATIWRADVLASYLRRDENGWMFEIYGTRRARARNERFLTANPKIFGTPATRIFPYAHAGIIKGKWVRYTAELFQREGILVDFDRRGYHRIRPAFLRRLQLLRKLLEDPLRLLAALAGR